MNQTFAAAKKLPTLLQFPNLLSISTHKTELQRNRGHPVMFSKPAVRLNSSKLSASSRVIDHWNSSHLSLSLVCQLPPCHSFNPASNSLFLYKCFTIVRYTFSTLPFPSAGRKYITIIIDKGIQTKPANKILQEFQPIGSEF